MPLHQVFNLETVYSFVGKKAEAKRSERLRYFMR